MNRYTELRLNCRSQLSSTAVMVICVKRGIFSSGLKKSQICWLQHLVGTSFPCTFRTSTYSAILGRTTHELECLFVSSSFVCNLCPLSCRVSEIYERYPGTYKLLWSWQFWIASLHGRLSLTVLWNSNVLPRLLCRVKASASSLVIVTSLGAFAFSYTELGRGYEWFIQFKQLKLNNSSALKLLTCSWKGQIGVKFR